MDIVFFVGRLVLGLFFVMKGVNHFQAREGLTAYAQSKKLPAPAAGVVLSGIVMLLAGLSLVFGVYVEIALWALAVLMLLIAITMHKFWAETDPGARSNEKISFMNNMAHMGALLMLLQLADATLPYALNIF